MGMLVVLLSKALDRIAQMSFGWLDCSWQLDMKTDKVSLLSTGLRV